MTITPDIDPAPRRLDDLLVSKFRRTIRSGSSCSVLRLRAGENPTAADWVAHRLSRYALTVLDTCHSAAPPAGIDPFVLSAFVSTAQEAGIFTLPNEWDDTARVWTVRHWLIKRLRTISDSPRQGPYHILFVIDRAGAASCAVKWQTYVDGAAPSNTLLWVVNDAEHQLIARNTLAAARSTAPDARAPRHD